MAFEFRLPPDLTLRLTPENTTLARDVAFASGIHSMDPTELSSAIEALANPQGEVAKPHLLALFSSRPQNVIQCISTCYDALQRRGHAPMDELMTALSILCNCTKSDKLAAAFEVFDPQGRGSLGRVALLRMMRAFMVGIWSFAGVPVSAQIAETAAWFADAICKEVASTRVSFEDFGEFYNVAGFHVMSWVETLDLTKWPDEATDENEEPTVSFEVPIADEKTCRVVFSREDVSTLQALVTRTGLSELDAQVVCRLLLDCSSDGVLDESVYETWCERQLLPAGVLDDDERSTYMRLLSSLYDAFNRDGRGAVDAAEFASGFSVLCAGSKSAKLAAAWELLDDDGDGLLTRRGLWRYLRSFLTILMGACEVATEEGLNTVRVAADEGAIWLSTHIFTQAATNTIAFNFFADWCGVGVWGAGARARELNPFSPTCRRHPQVYGRWLHARLVA